jgi:hypothetical protein
VTYRLVTTILDPSRAPAAELAALYAQRWEQETALEELKTHQRGPGVVLRSKTPAMVEQEVWAHLLVHYAIRKLMHQAAREQDLDPTGCRYRHAADRAPPPDQPRGLFPLTSSPGPPGGRSASS